MRAKACFPKIYSESVRMKNTCKKIKGLSTSVEGLFLLLRNRKHVSDRFRLDAIVGRLVGNLHSMAMNRQNSCFYEESAEYFNKNKVE